uniref:DRBM domain-containing protein n=1 Tax=Leersia perrieri TaxID=77586 RepID=A0A0D9XFL6_9ORYZ
MEGGGGEGNGGGGERVEVVEMEDAVGILVNNLVRPLLRKGNRMTPENQADVARQVHTAVILYNYYHRKQFPHLDFADPKRFIRCASLALGENLLAYSNMVHQHEKSSGSSGEDVNLSVTDTAVMDACEIAEALDASQDSPEMTMWPISKVAVLLLDSTKKRCLLECNSVGKKCRSLLEKDIDTSSTEHSSNHAAEQDLKNEESPKPLAYVLQTLAFSEVERRTGMERSSLRLLDEHLAYSLTKKGTTAKVFILQYEQTAKGNFVEMPIEELIKRMTGPVVEKHPFPTTTAAAENYHILPYKDILSDCANRKWHFDSSVTTSKEQARRNGRSSSHSERDENSKERESSIKGSMQKRIKREIKVDGRNKRSSSVSNVNSKRKSEVLRATAADGAEDLDSEEPQVNNVLPSVVDVKTKKFMDGSVNAKETAATSEGFLDIEAGVQMDNKRREKHSVHPNISQDMAVEKALVIKDSDLEWKSAEVSKKPGGGTKENKDLKYASFKSYLKKRDDLHCKQRLIEDETVQFDMDIQTVFAGGDWTPEAMALLEKYDVLVDSLHMVETADGSSYSGDGYETLTIERKKLSVETLLRNKCQVMQELDEVCRANNWILPRYKVVPSMTDGMYQASVDIACLEFSQMTFGDKKTSPRDARESAAANLLKELLKKAGAIPN